MLSKTTSSLARSAAQVGRIFSVALPATAVSSSSSASSTAALASASLTSAFTSPAASAALTYAPTRFYSLGKWATDLRRKQAEKRAISAAGRAKRAAWLEKNPPVESVHEARKRAAIDATFPKAVFITMLFAARDPKRVRTLLRDIDEAAKTVPLLSREVTLILQALRRFPEHTKYAFDLFQRSVTNPALYIESRTLIAIKDIAENGHKYHAWLELETAHQRLFPRGTTNWLGEHVTPEVTGSFTLAPMAELLARDSTPEEVIKMIAAKRAAQATSGREVLPKTIINAALAHFKLGQTDKALAEMWTFWSLAGFTTGPDAVPAPFAPVKAFFRPQWQFTRADLPVNLNSMIALSSACERAGQFSAALANLAMARTYLDKVDHAGLREVTPAGRARDYYDLSHLGADTINQVMRLTFVEMRIRRAMAAAMAALPQDKRPVTQNPPGAFPSSSPFLSSAVEDVVILTDRSFALTKAPKDNGPLVRKFMANGAGLFGVDRINVNTSCFSALSGTGDAELKAKAELEASARAGKGDDRQLMRPDRTVIVTKEVIEAALDRSSKAIKEAKYPF